MNIIDYIPIGKDNAVSRRQLVALTGWDDRTVREAIETAKHNGALVINLGGGYFVADKAKDQAEIRRYRDAINHRVRAQMHYEKFYTAALEG